MLRTRALGLLVAVAAGCTADNVPATPPTISLHHLAKSGPIPISASEELAILGEDRVCVLDSYEVRIVCGDRRWEETVYLGRKGSGPGEILTPGPLLHMPEGGLAYYDLRNDRLTLYTPSLQFGGHLRLPSQGQPVPPITADSLLLISNQGFAASRGTIGELQLTRRQSQILTFNIGANAVVDSIPFSIDLRVPGIATMMAAPIQRDSTRVTMTRDPEENGTGIRPQWLNWYRITEQGSTSPAADRT